MIKQVADNKSTIPVPALAWGLWFLATLFFAFQMVPRLWLGVVREQVMAQLSIGTDMFGYICACYYIGYAGMQIPLAMILDRWSPRWVFSGCIVLLGASLWMFGEATHWHVAALARFLTGLSSAAGFLGVSKVLEMWFPSRLYAAILGASISLGIMGSVFGGRPMLWLIESYGPSGVNHGMVVFCLGLAAIMMMVMRSPDKKSVGRDTITLQMLKQLFKNPTIWVLGLINLLLVGSLEGFADAWAEPFLVTGFGMSSEHALSLASLVFIGLIAGSPVIPFLGQRFGHGVAILWCGLGIIAAFVLMFVLALMGFASVPPHWLVGGILFFIGACCSYQTNLLTLGREAVSPMLVGVVVALLNAWNMSGGTIFHTIIGLVLKNRPAATNGLMVLVNYVWALSCVPLAALVGVVCLMMVRDRKQHSD